MSETEFLQMKVESLEKKIRCVLCHERPKEVMLACNHMFCNECVAKSLKARKRECPLDRSKITSEKEMRKLHWGDE